MKLISSLLLRIRSGYWNLIYSGYRKRYQVDSTFRFNGAAISFYGPGNIICGRDSYVGELSTFQAADHCRIVVGIGCAISHNVRVYTSSWDPDSDFSLPMPEIKDGNVEFADYCWVGANVFINPGIRIGLNSVIGANSVVTRNIPDNEIWGGVPARLIRKKN